MNLLPDRYLLLILFTLFTSLLPANSKRFMPKESFVTSQGLAHNGVTAVLKDSHGYIWFCTYDGVNRYYGDQFQEYKNSIENDILISNRVRSILEDGDGNIWLGTDEGISIFNYSEENFSTIYTNNFNKNSTGPTVRKLLQSKDKNRIYAVTETEGVLVFDRDYSVVKHIYSNSFEDNKINDATLIDDQHIAIASTKGVITLNINSGETSVQGEVNSTANSINYIDTDRFLIGYNDKIVVAKYDSKLEDKPFITLAQYKPGTDIKSSYIDRFKDIWIGTLLDGIIKIDNVDLLQRGEAVEIQRYRDETGILRMSCFYETETDCWAATFNKGVLRFNFFPNPFLSYDSSQDDDFSGYNKTIVYISKFDSIRALLSSNRYGLAFLDTETGVLRSAGIIYDKSSQRGSNVYVDSRKTIWIRRGVDLFRCRYAEGERSFSKLDIRSPFFKGGEPMRSITEDRKGNIWVGTTLSLYKIVMKSGKADRVIDFKNNEAFKQIKRLGVRSIYADTRYPYMWVGTEGDGLFRVKLEAGPNRYQIDKYQHNRSDKSSISANFVSSIIRLSNGDLWLGTEGGGVCKVDESDPDNLIFTTFSKRDGLSDNVVKSIFSDNESCLWISTNMGLNKFDPESLRFYRYGVDDGLPFDNFGYPITSMANGTVVLSGTEGYCYFNPDSLLYEEELPVFEFGELSIATVTVKVGDTINGHLILDKRLADKQVIELTYEENNIGIELRSIHYSNPNNHLIRYRLIPLSEDWIEIPSSQRELYFNGLAPGDYTLEVIASNSFDEWTAPHSLEINITPPYWKTSIAYILYILVLIAMVAAILFYILRFQRLKHHLHIEQLEKDKISEVNGAKLQFFSNISHEIKTPITLISGPVAQLAEQFKGDKSVIDKLNIVQRQSKKISGLVDQVHDFQRSDANALKMNLTRFNLVNFIQELIVDFNYMAKSEKKNLILEGFDSAIYLNADEDKLSKIINNLLNNAFKFTKSEGTVKLQCDVEDKVLILKVVDDGKGIEVDDLPFIFDRFYQSKKMQDEYIGGSGIGLAFAKRLVQMHFGSIGVESVVKSGTTFTVKLPIIDQTDQGAIEIEQEILSDESKLSSKLFEVDGSIEGLEVIEELKESTVFVVEDNVELRKFISNMMSDHFNVKVFENGKECVERLESEWPDIIVSDILMPEMNGFDLCRHVKSDIKTSHIPVILLTACTDAESRLKGVQEGADSYIHKPFNIRFLISQVHNLLQGRKTLRERFEMNIPLSLNNMANSGKDAEFIKKLYRLMEENLDNRDLDLDLFAKELYLNRTHFYQKVKALTDETPYELLKLYRLKRAAHFLLQDRVSVNEVVDMTGFKSRPHFSKLFKEKYGVTPGKFYESNRADS